MNCSTSARTAAQLGIFAFLFAVFSQFAFAFSPMKTVTAETEKGVFAFTVELANDDASRTKGLMFRRTMKPLHGMLFRFEATRPISMWMKNTFVSLDMAFLDEQGRITHIHRGATPQSLDIITSRGPVRYVLEVNAGEALKTGLKPGIQMSHPWFARP